MGLTLFKTTRGRKEGKCVPQTSENAWLSLWQGIWTSAGASSMSVESAVTQVSVDQSATDSAALPHLIWHWYCPVDFVIFEIVPLIWSPLKEGGRQRLCRHYWGRYQPEIKTNQNNASVFSPGVSKSTRKISISQDYHNIIVKSCISSQVVFCMF